MQDLNEKQNKEMPEESIAKQNEELRQQNERLIEMIMQLQRTEILQSQKLFNEWAMMRLEKIAEAVNQIGAGISLILSEKGEIEKSASEEEAKNDESEEDAEIEEIEEEAEPETKKAGRGRPKKITDLKRIVNAARGYGDNLRKGMKEADPDSQIE